MDCFNILIQEFQIILEIRIDMRRVAKRTLSHAYGVLIFKFGRILGVNVKGWVRCQMKGFPEFRINIERNGWGRVFCACDAAGILTNSSF